MYAHETAHFVHIWQLGLISSGSPKQPALSHTRFGYFSALLNTGEAHCAQNSRVIFLPLSTVLV